MTTPDILTLKQAAEYLQMSPPQLRRLLKAGRIPGHKIGRDWRFLTAELSAWIKGRPGDYGQKKEEGPQPE